MFDRLADSSAPESESAEDRPAATIHSLALARLRRATPPARRSPPPRAPTGAADTAAARDVRVRAEALRRAQQIADDLRRGNVAPYTYQP